MPAVPDDDAKLGHIAVAKVAVAVHGSSVIIVVPRINQALEDGARREFEVTIKMTNFPGGFVLQTLRVAFFADAVHEIRPLERCVGAELSFAEHLISFMRLNYLIQKTELNLITTS